MDVGTTLVLVFALTLALVRAQPVNDNEGDIDVCENKCRVNEFCDESQGICLDCSLCATSVYCARQDCQLGGDNTNNTNTTNALHQTTKATDMSQPGSSFISQSSRPTIDDDDDDKDDGGDMKSSKNNSREKKDINRNVFLTSTIAICGGFVVGCVGAYMYFCHPLGFRSQEIMKERDQMAGINSDEIYRRASNKATEKVPLQ